MTHMSKKKPINTKDGKRSGERPIPEKIYPSIDTDLGRDNVENDLPAADKEDL